LPEYDPDSVADHQTLFEVGGWTNPLSVMFSVLHAPSFALVFKRKLVLDFFISKWN